MPFISSAFLISTPLSSVRSSTEIPFAFSRNISGDLKNFIHKKLAHKHYINEWCKYFMNDWKMYKSKKQSLYPSPFLVSTLLPPTKGFSSGSEEVEWITYRKISEMSKTIYEPINNKETLRHNNFKEIFQTWMFRVRKSGQLRKSKLTA